MPDNNSRRLKLLLERLRAFGLDPDADDPFAGGIKIGANKNAVNVDDLQRFEQSKHPILKAWQEKHGRPLQVGDIIEGPPVIDFRGGRDPLDQLRDHDDLPSGINASAGGAPIARELMKLRSIYDALKSGEDPSEEDLIQTFGAREVFSNAQIDELKQINSQSRDEFLRANPGISNQGYKDLVERSRAVQSQLQAAIGRGGAAHRKQAGGGGEFMTQSQIENALRGGEEAKGLLGRLGHAREAELASATAKGEISSEAVTAGIISQEQFNQMEAEGKNTAGFKVLGGTTAQEGSAKAVTQAQEQGIHSQIQDPSTIGKQVGGVGRVLPPEKPRDPNFTGVDPNTGVQFPEKRRDFGGSPRSRAATAPEPQGGTRGSVAFGEGAPQGFGAGIEIKDGAFAPEGKVIPKTSEAPVETPPDPSSSVRSSELPTTPPVETPTTTPDSIPDPEDILNQSATQSGMIGASSDPVTAEKSAGAQAGSAYAEYDKALSDQEKLYGVSVKGARDRDREFQDFLSGWGDRYERAYDSAIGISEGVRNRSQKTLLEEKRNAEQRLIWNEDKDKRQAERDKSAEIEEAQNALAIAGGSFSPLATQQIREAERAWDMKIIDIEKEHGFERADLSAQFTTAYNKIEETFLTDSRESLDKYIGSLEGLEGQGFSSTQARKAAEDAALGTYVTESGKVRMARAKAINEQVKAMDETRKEKIKEGDDKLAAKSRIRGDIQRDKTITSANDVDGFYGSLQASNNRYLEILSELKGKKILATSVEGTTALGPSQTGVVAGLARIFDPGSVVRSEEFERQTKGQSWVNILNGFWQKVKGGGIGLTPTDVAEMVIVAEQVHESWEQRYQIQMQQFISDVDDWNTNHPDNTMHYKDVLPFDRLPMAEETEDKWTLDAGEDEVEPPSLNWKSSIGSGNIISGSKFHTGLDAKSLDIDGQIGDPVSAFAGGRVTQVDNVGKGGYGKFAIVTDGHGFKKMYAHLDNVEVKEGSTVSVKDSIGTMGNTGNVISLGGDGSHLHFRITRDGKPFDMEEYLSIVRS